MAYPEYVCGSGSIGLQPMEDSHAYISILRKHNIIDTALLYSNSEKRLGELSTPASFTIDTKSPSLARGTLTRASITAGLAESLSRLQANQVYTYYLHISDPSTPIDETVDAMQALHRQGQGNSGAFARHLETTLFPVLRGLRIAFSAYSALAGGLVAKDPEKLEADAEGGRWTAQPDAPDAMLNDIYISMFHEPEFIEALREWRVTAAEAGESPAMLAYRCWAVWNSKLGAGERDAVVIGASRPSRLEQTLEGLARGLLKEETVGEIEGLWERVKAVAPVHSYHSYAKNMLYN